ncbi:MAG: transglycosylase domain-containing protein [Deltaproteobacteria bacterium]|nr:transglycosylase domain-containing protein [Deltaproteobacteria bacterium]
MRKLLALVMGVVFLLALGVPASYLVLARDLPPLWSRDEVVHTMKIFVEGQRQQQFAGVNSQLVEPFVSLGEDELSAPLVNGALAASGCPDYFGPVKEDGSAWLGRVVSFGMGNGYGSPGPGRCELLFADRLAIALGLPSGPHRALAAYEIHQSLTPRELIDLELSVRYFAPGILGVRAASKRLMGKEPKALNVAETAELLLAEVDYDEVWRCKNPTLLKIKRNNVIEEMAGFNLLPRPEAERAKNQSLRCLGRPG